MALSPADFAAYSRATGTPYPEDPEERAALAPQVLEFRRNQLQSPKQEPNLPGILGAAVLGLGALAGGAYAAKRFAAGRAQVPPSKIPQQGVAAVERLGTINRQRAAEEVTRQARAERMPGVVQADLSAVNKLLNDPGLLSLVEQQEAIEGLSPAGLKEFRGAESKARNQYRMAITQIGDEIIAQERAAIQAPVVKQTIGALGSGEDQATGRAMLGAQRNEDLDLSKINSIARQAGSADIALSMTPDGIPLDQAENIPLETSAQRFLQRERDEIASELGEQGLALTPGRIDAELARRLGSSAAEYGPQYSARRQALELFAQTGDPKLLEKIQRFGMAPVTFETFENMPAAKRAGFEVSAPFSTEYYPSEQLSPVGLSSNIEITLPGQGRVSLADIRKPVITEDTALAAEEYYQEKKGQALDWLGDLRVKLEPQRNAILKERRILAEQSARELLPQLETARQTGQEQVARELEGQLQNLRTLWTNPELGSHRADEYRYLTAQIKGAQRKIGESIADIQKKYPTTLSDWSGEAGRVFGEVDPNTGEFIPETMELRAERRAAELPQKGGGGRNIAEYTAGERLDEEIRAIQGGGRIRDYDIETGGATSPWLGDKTQTGRAIDIYGIRPSAEKPANPDLRPSQPQYTKAEIADEAMRLSSSSPEGDVPIAPDYEAVIESLGSQPKTEAAMRSVLMSEAIRKAERMRSGRNPRGGVLPDELTTLRKNLSSTQAIEPEFLPEGKRKVRGLGYERQETLPGVTGYAARQRQSAADVAAQQLETYMSKLQRGRSTPLTSEVVIQPRLF